MKRKIKLSHYPTNAILIFVLMRRCNGAKHSELNWKIIRREYNYIEQVITKEKEDETRN